MRLGHLQGMKMANGKIVSSYFNCCQRGGYCCGQQYPPLSTMVQHTGSQDSPTPLCTLILFQLLISSFLYRLDTLSHKQESNLNVFISINSSVSAFILKKVYVHQ